MPRDVPPIRGAELQVFLREVNNGRRVIDEHHLERHHPDIYLAWRKVRLAVWTHKIDGLTESDFVFAATADTHLKTASGP